MTYSELHALVAGKISDAEQAELLRACRHIWDSLIICRDIADDITALGSEPEIPEDSGDAVYRAGRNLSDHISGTFVGVIDGDSWDKKDSRDGKDAEK